jgi:hypothetical protein
LIDGTLCEKARAVASAPIWFPYEKTLILYDWQNCAPQDDCHMISDPLPKLKCGNGMRTVVGQENTYHRIVPPPEM